MKLVIEYETKGGFDYPSITFHYSLEDESPEKIYTDFYSELEAAIENNNKVDKEYQKIMNTLREHRQNGLPPNHKKRKTDEYYNKEKEVINKMHDCHSRKINSVKIRNMEFDIEEFIVRENNESIIDYDALKIFTLDQWFDRNLIENSS